MKRIFLLSFILFLFAFNVSAQNEARQISKLVRVNCEEYLARADEMMGEQSRNPNSKIYVFVYVGKEAKFSYDKGNINYKLISPQSNLAIATIQTMKARLQIRKIQLENYVFVEAGFRDEFTVEIWNVPNNIEPPKPSPTLENMKYRRGKSKGFCIGCC